MEEKLCEVYHKMESNGIRIYYDYHTRVVMQCCSSFSRNMCPPHGTEYQKHKRMFLGSEVQLVHGADNLTAIYEPIV
jgi:hypothetical protein